MSKILQGKELAEEVLFSLREKIVKAEKSGNEHLPGLATVMVGEDEASKLYVRNKKRACHKVGMSFHDYWFEDGAKEEEVLETIDFLNNDPAVRGIIVQLPLPKEFNTEKIIKSISPKKDVDGFHPVNLKKFKSALSPFACPASMAGEGGASPLSSLEGGMGGVNAIVVPPVVKAVVALLDQVEEPIKGKSAVIISKNEIFAEPLLEAVKLKKVNIEIIAQDKAMRSPALRLSGVRDSFAHSDAGGKLKQADIIITAVGIPNFLKGEMIKYEAIIIDVGTTLVDGKLVGDADFKSCEKKASYISPVPGGIGPLTVAYLLENTVKAWEIQNIG